jgi:hypothetical protein
MQTQEVETQEAPAGMGQPPRPPPPVAFAEPERRKPEGPKQKEGMHWVLRLLIFTTGLLVSFAVNRWIEK